MRRRKATVELFEQIRREYEHGVGSVAGVARKYGVHRRMVREALAMAVPQVKAAPERRKPRIEPVAAFIDAILEADQTAPRKQRHTAHRIYERLRRERPDCPVGESTVRRYVRERKRELGMAKLETFVPQHYSFGSEAQVDWYEAVAELDGERTKLDVFTMRSMATGKAFHRAYRRATQQAFLEGHELAFRHFGGAFQRVRYDNLASAVKRVLQGRQREETARFVAFRSHWGYESVFCRPGKEGAHEKGGIEGEVGRFRRKHWVPVPSVEDLESLNRQLITGCVEDEGRRLDGRQQTVGASALMEQAHLRPLPEVDFDLAEWTFPKVGKLGTVRVGTNAYSVPAAPGTTVRAKIMPTSIEIWHEGRIVAHHERCYGRQQEILDLEHYLGALEQKPAALAGSRPLEQWRRLGKWPASYDRFWEGLVQRRGVQAGTREMIRLLHLGRTHGYHRLREAIEQALDLNCVDVAAVEHLMSAHLLGREPARLTDIGPLLAFERALPAVSEYDQLLAGGAR